MHARGFTLIELLVSVAVFSVVMLIAVGSLLTMAEASRKAQALKSVMNNLNFAMESMSRTIRVGASYTCGSTCESNGSTYLSLEGSGGDRDTLADQVVYCLGSGSSCSSSGNSILRSLNGGGTFVPITASEVIIEDLKFYVVGELSGSADNIQPKVVIVLRGYTEISKKTRTEFNLQTTITQRLLDL